MAGSYVAWAVGRYLGLPALATAGFAVGSNWESIVSAFHSPTYIIAAVVVLLLLAPAQRRTLSGCLVV